MTHLGFLLQSVDRISTHTPLAGRDEANARYLEKLSISTHTPLAGRDRSLFLLPLNLLISTHTPLAGRDVTVSYPDLGLTDFYSHAPRGA